MSGTRVREKMGVYLGRKPGTNLAAREDSGIIAVSDRPTA